jgi:predicted P-loop ATPase
VQTPTKDVFDDLTEAERGQILAEAVQLFRRGESLHLSADLEAEANQVQAIHTEKDERAGAIAEFLEMLYPARWESWDTDERRGYLNTDPSMKEVGTVQRKYVCVAEIHCELFGRRIGEMTTQNTKHIHAILRGLPGWTPMDKVRRFKNYGHQKGYCRC